MCAAGCAAVAGQQEGPPQAQQPEQPGGWFCPGSVLRMTADPKHPLAFGMPAEHYATSTGGQYFEIRESAAEKKPRAFVWYAKNNLLASGWVSGERVVAGRPAAVEAPLGRGRVILFGFRPQFRGQTLRHLPSAAECRLAKRGRAARAEEPDGAAGCAARQGRR